VFELELQPIFQGEIVKEKAMFVASVAVAIMAIAAFQKHVYKVPVVGAYLPGGA
jgi:hypothetical protein